MTETAAEKPSRASRLTLRRFAVFGGTVGLIIVSAAATVAVTWIRFGPAYGSRWVWGGVVLAAGFVPAVFLGLTRNSPAVRVLYTASAALLGFVSFGMLAAAVCWLGLGVSAALGRTWNLKPLAEAAYSAALAATLYGLANAVRLRVTRVVVRLAGLPQSWQGRSVVLATDIHLGNIRGARSLRRLVARISELSPAAVLISGDLFDGPRVDIEAVTRPLVGLSAPHGVYFVTGNHDEFSDRSVYFPHLERAGIRILHNERLVLDGLQLVGVHDGETREADLFRRILAESGLDRAAPSILLAHQPSHLEIPEEAGISLQLSGHTHGGQFWPWSWVASRVHGRFAYGLNKMGNMQVLTSSGVGTWGPPLRVGTRSEIVLIRLERA